jgi:Domain of unknown function (DUF4352)
MSLEKVQCGICKKVFKYDFQDKCPSCGAWKSAFREPSPDSARNCINCGSLNKKGAHFCSNCGSEIPKVKTSEKKPLDRNLKTQNFKEKPLLELANGITLFIRFGLILVVTAIIFIFINNFHHNKTSNTVSTSNQIYLTQDALDGQFKFQVTAGPKCNLSKVGDAYNNVVAKGQFCSIRLLITNISDKPADFFDSNQKLFDTSGNEYSPSSEADFVANGGVSYDSINPGLKILGDLYFDLPANAVPGYVMLHDSAFSGGVKVFLQNDPAVVKWANDINQSDSKAPSDFYPIGKDFYSKWLANPKNCDKHKNLCLSFQVYNSKVCKKGINISIYLFAKEQKSFARIGLGSTEFLKAGSISNITKIIPREKVYNTDSGTKLDSDWNFDYTKQISTISCA